jgi:MFS superfamily sulfate permease-like transporter
MPLIDGLMPWSLNWLWSLPLSVLCVVIHVFGLNLIRTRFYAALDHATARTLSPISLAAMAVTTVCVTVLHGMESAIWATGFRLLGALPDEKTAMLYSLNAMTTFGHAGYNLEGEWHLMGALEALNGWILFGLSTAFLYAMNQKVWRLGPELEQRVIIQRKNEIEVSTTTF